MTINKKKACIALILIVSTQCMGMKMETSKPYRTKADAIFQKALDYAQQGEQAINAQVKETLYKKFMKCLTEAAEANHNEAQERLATEYLKKSRQTSDSAEKIKHLDAALQWGRKAAALEEPKMLCALACLYEEKRNSTQNCEQQKFCWDESLKYFTAAAEKGYVDAQTLLGLALIKSAKDRDDSEVQAALCPGLNWLVKAAAQGDPIAQDELGVDCLKRSISIDDPQAKETELLKALSLFEQAAQSGLVSPHYHLSNVYLTKSSNTSEASKKEEFLDKALVSALRYNELCAANKSNCSLLQIALIYELMYEITVDQQKKDECLDQAISWTEKEKSNADIDDDTRLKLAHHYWQKSKRVDAHEKEKLLKQAELELLPLAEQKPSSPVISKIFNNLGFIYKELSECAHDPRQKKELLSKSVMWLTKSAKKNNGLSQKTLGEIKQEKDKKKICAACDARVVGPGCCGGCKLVYYCSRECQKAHWPIHKDTCKNNEQS